MDLCRISSQSFGVTAYHPHSPYSVSHYKMMTHRPTISPPFCDALTIVPASDVFCFPYLHRVTLIWQCRVSQASIRQFWSNAWRSTTQMLQDRAPLLQEMYWYIFSDFHTSKTNRGHRHYPQLGLKPFLKSNMSVCGATPLSLLGISSISYANLPRMMSFCLLNCRVTLGCEIPRSA